MVEFLSLALEGEAPPPILAPQTIYCITQANRVRWTLSPGSATEGSTNTVAGTHDGLTTSFDGATSALDGGLAYSVGYSVQTPTLTEIASVTLRFRYLANATQGASVALYEVQGVYDNTAITDSLITPVQFDWTWFEWEMELDPDSLDAWTANGVSSKKWGFTFDSGAATGVNTFSVAEIELRIDPP